MEHRYCVAMIYMNGVKTVIPFHNMFTAASHAQEMANANRMCHVYLGELVEQSTSTETEED
jgi:hypothetical protein